MKSMNLCSECRPSLQPAEVRTRPACEQWTLSGQAPGKPGRQTVYNFQSSTLPGTILFVLSGLWGSIEVRGDL
jgi:hypothetical protein